MEKQIKLHPRRLARMMAKAQLDRRGAVGYNKHKKSASTFANTWRQFAVEAMQSHKKKGAKK